PGDQGALQRTASDLAGRPLRKDRPLWELHLLDGYGEGSALLLRTHHAIADGGALMQVLLSLADPLEAGEHTGVLPVHDDTAGPPLLPGPGGRAGGRGRLPVIWARCCVPRSPAPARQPDWLAPPAPTRPCWASSASG